MCRCFCWVCGLIALLVFVVAARGQTTQPATQPATAPSTVSWVDFDGRDMGFRLKFPESMRRMPVDQPGVALVLLRPQLDPTQAQVLVTLPPELKSVDAYVQTFQRSMSDPRLLEAADTTLGGQPARRFVIQGHQVQGGRDTKAQLVVALRNDKLYSVVAMAEPSGFDSLKATVDRIIDSFQWTK